MQVPVHVCNKSGTKQASKDNLQEIAPPPLPYPCPKPLTILTIICSLHFHIVYFIFWVCTNLIVHCIQVSFLRSKGYLWNVYSIE